MPDHQLAGHFHHFITNLGISVGMLSITVALVTALYRRRPQYRWLTILFAGLFAGAGIGRAFIALGMEGYGSLAADSVACVCAVGAGVLIWTTLQKVVSQPTYEQLADANRAFEQQRTLFNAFMENSPAPCFLEDQDARLLYVNAAFERQVGVSREQVLFRPASLWATPEQKREIQEHNKQCQTENRPIARTLYFPRKPGEAAEPWYVVRFPVNKSVAEGAAVGAIALNLADEQGRSQANAKLAAIVESSQDAIIGKDLDGNITAWNRGAEELYGYSAQEAIGKPITMLAPPERMDEVRVLLDKLKRGLRVDNYETVRLSKEGQLKHVSLSLAPIRTEQGEITGAAVIARDITREKLQQAEIEQLNKQLRDRIYELAEHSAALQTARDQALEASNLKSAFCANISHELRTPLSGIIGLNEILLLNDNLKGDDLYMCRMVQESAQALLTIVNDILDLSKIEAGKITLEYAPFSLSRVLQDCTSLMAPTARQKQLKFDVIVETELPAMVYGDVSRLRQILLNLIGNAIKFTEKGGIEVRVEVKQINSDQAALRFSIKDTGIGIAAEDQRLLFVPFAQVDNSLTRKFGGTGLGLTISKRFVELMGGEIGLESELQKGSTFWFELTFDLRKLHKAQDFAVADITQPIKPIAQEITRGRRLLLVEDNAVLQHLALRQLNSLGVDCDAVQSGREAIHLALTDKYDLVLMDINLPDINGLEATAAIRNLEHSAMRPQIPIIAMTAGAMKGDRERALAAGMNDYLSKPVAIEQLKDTLELWLQKSKVRQHVPPSVPASIPLAGPEVVPHID